MADELTHRGDEPMTIDAAREILRREMPEGIHWWLLSTNSVDADDVRQHWGSLSSWPRGNQESFTCFEFQDDPAPAVAACLKVAKEWAGKENAQK